MDEELVGRAEVGLDGEGEELAASLGGRLEDGQAEDLLVQVQRHVAAQLLGVVGQNLERGENRHDIGKLVNLLRKNWENN